MKSSSAVGGEILSSSTPEVPLVRQLPAPGRLAVCIAASLAVAASAGCMSVGGDPAKPTPARSAGRPGTVSRPDGVPGVEGVLPPGGWYSRPGPAGRPAPGPNRRGLGLAAEEGAVVPGPSLSLPPLPGSTKAVRPGGSPPAGEPVPPGSSPSVPVQEPTHTEPSFSQPPVASPPPDPVPDQEPEPPADVPSASPAADVHVGAMSAGERPALREPTASPQLGPV